MCLDPVRAGAEARQRRLGLDRNRVIAPGLVPREHQVIDLVAAGVVLQYARRDAGIVRIVVDPVPQLAQRRIRAGEGESHLLSVVDVDEIAGTDNGVGTDVPIHVLREVGGAGEDPHRIVVGDGQALPFACVLGLHAEFVDPSVVVGSGGDGPASEQSVPRCSGFGVARANSFAPVFKGQLVCLCLGCSSQAQADACPCHPFLFVRFCHLAELLV